MAFSRILDSAKKIVFAVAVFGMHIAPPFLFSQPVAAQVDTVQNTVRGLPPGLEVFARATVLRCDPNGVSEPVVGSTQLVEQTMTTFEPVIQLNGLTTIQAITRTTYSGAFVATIPNSNGCTFRTDNYRVDYVIVGQTLSGTPTGARLNGVLTSVLSGNDDRIIDYTATAETRDVQDTTIFGLPVIPSTIPRNQQFQRWSVTYTDEMGSGHVGTPSLELTQPGIALGYLTTITRLKMWITDDNQICLRVSTNQQCGPMNSGAAVTVGGVTVSKDTTSSLDSTRRRVSWKFQLNSTFPAGNYNAVVNAKHLDHILYNVNGAPTQQKLLTWKPKSIPIIVN